MLFKDPRLWVVLFVVAPIVPLPLFAAVREEQAVGPADPSLMYVVSPRGSRVAWVAWREGQARVSVDGEPGPAFDSILPVHDHVGFAPQEETARSSQFVVFSPNGERYAYLAQTGRTMVLIVDGRERLRQALPADMSATPWHLSFTGEAGRHLALFHPTSDTAALWIDGTPQPNLTTPGLVLSSDGAHYAYATRRSGEPRLVVDGVVTDYAATQPQFTQNGRHVIAIGHSARGECVLSDGRPFYSARHIERVILAPGDHGLISVVDEDAEPDASSAADQTTRWHQVLVVNGREPTALHGLRTSIGRIIHSPNGLRYAAIVRTPEAQCVVIDGEIGSRFDRVVPDSFVFSADSRRYAYLASQYDTSYLVVDGVRSVVPADGRTITFSPDGRRIAISGTAEIMADGERLGLSGTSTFSPDSAHLVVAGRRLGDGKTGLFVDGQLVYENSKGLLSWAFSADGRHLYWLAREPDPNPLSTVDDLVTYADGRNVDRTYLAPNVRTLLELNWRTRDTAFGRTSPLWDLGPRGEIVLLGAVGRQLRASRIFSPTETSITTLLERRTPDPVRSGATTMANVTDSADGAR